MKRYTLALSALALASGMVWAQAGGSTQSAPAAQPDQSSATKKQAESDCMKWAKQQAGLEQSDSSQQPSSSGKDNQAGAQPDKSAPPKPADNSSQSNASSGAAGAASEIAGSLGGAANSKAAQIVQQAYTHCMEKKGFKVK